MADSSRTVKISFVGDAKSFADAVQSMEQKSDGLSSKLGGIFGGLAKGAAGLAVFDLAAGGVSKLTGGLQTLADAADESAKVQAQTVQAIQSTGGAANVSADHVSNFATSLSQVAPFDDEVIQSGENLLLTFTNLRNEAGKGNDIFDQSTKIMLDMSQALGQDTKTSAIQLGKALNDPITGMSALQRVGVSFTDSQKKQITTLQQSGDLMGAQKIVLAELTKEFGGSAEAAGKTFGGQLTILKTQLGNVQEALGAALLPALISLAQKAIPFVVEAGNKAGDLVTNVLIPGISSLAGKLSGPLTAGFDAAVAGAKRLSNVFDIVRGLFDYMRGGGVDAANVMQNALNRLFGGTDDSIGQGAQKVSGFLLDMADKVRAFAGFLRDDALPAIVGFGEQAGSIFLDLAGKLVGPVSAGFGLLGRLLGDAVGAFSDLRHWVSLAESDLTNIGHIASGTMLGVPDSIRPIVPLLSKVLDLWHLLGDGVTTFKEALAGNWVDSSGIAGIHRVFGEAGIAVHALGLAFDDLRTKGFVASGTLLAFPPAIRPIVSAFSDLYVFVREKALPAIRDFATQAAQFITGTLLPAFKQLADTALPPIKELVGFLIDHKGDVIAAVTGVALAFGVWTAATKAQELATKGMTIAQEALDAIMAASPVGLAIAAIAAASVLLYEAWQHDWGGIREITQQVLTWLQTNIPPILAAIQSGIQAFVGFVKLLFDGDWSQAWTQVQTAVSGAKDWLVTTGLPAIWAGLQSFFTDTLPKIAAQLLAWGQAFVSWVAPQIPPLLLELGKLYVELEKWLLTVALPAIVTDLAKWGAEFVAWVAPQIPPLLLELGKLLLSLGDWLLTTALPAIVTKLGQWGGAFVAWVAPQIPPLLVELGKLLLKLGEWLLITALPDIATKLGQWGKAFSEWVPQAITDLLSKLGDLLLQVGTWIVKTAIPDVAGKFADMGKQAGQALLDSAWNAIKSGWKSFLGNVESLPGVKDVFGSGQPSGGGGGGTGGGGSSALGFIKPIAGQFVQGFYTGTHRVESAVDWAAPRGTPVYAPGAGTIVATGFNLDGDSGRGLDLVTPGGWEFVTGHMSGIVVADGQSVTRGQLIGYSGSPELDGGAGSGAHLHMAIKHNGAYVSGNPAEYIPLATGGIVTQPIHAIVGDSVNKDEAVIPIGKDDRVTVIQNASDLTGKLTLGGPGSEPVPVQIVSGTAGDTDPMPVKVVEDPNAVPGVNHFGQKYAKQITAAEAAKAATAAPASTPAAPAAPVNAGMIASASGGFVTKPGGGGPDSLGAGPFYVDPTGRIYTVDAQGAPVYITTPSDDTTLPLDQFALVQAAQGRAGDVRDALDNANRGVYSALNSSWSRMTPAQRAAALAAARNAAYSVAAQYGLSAADLQAEATRQGYGDLGYVTQSSASSSVYSGTADNTPKLQLDALKALHDATTQQTALVTALLRQLAQNVLGLGGGQGGGSAAFARLLG